MKKIISILLIHIFFFSYSNAETQATDEVKEARVLVIATEQVSISSELAARVEKINFLLGDAFKKGDVLISFDCKIYQAQQEVIQSEYDSAKIQLENDKELLDMRSIGKLQYQLSVSALNKAIAPYDGKVMDVYTSIFSTIEQRQPLMDIVGDGLLEAEIVVPSNWLKWLKKDHQVKITIDETGETLNAKIISLGATVDAISQTIELKAQFNKKYESLIPGMSGIVKF